MWSSTALSKLLLSDDGGKLSPFPLPVSVALHDVFALGKKKATHSVHDISGSGTFQVNTGCRCIPVACLGQLYLVYWSTNFTIGRMLPLPWYMQ